jgi:hypothetical protein
MWMVYAGHIAAGTLGFIGGYTALYSAKGASLHRKAGMAFVVAMIATAIFGMAIAVVRDVAPAINMPAGALTAYLAFTALSTVRPGAGSRPLDIAMLLIALGVVATMIPFGVQAVANGGTRNGLPAFPFFLFGVIGTLAVIGDVKMLRTGPLTGAPRLARHLWRMCMSLFLAAISFTVQLRKMVPKALGIPGALYAIPIVLVLGTMIYWLWRMRKKRGARAFAGVQVSAPEAA